MEALTKENGDAPQIEDINHLKRKIADLEVTVCNLTNWKKKLYDIYDIEEVLRWRKYISRWDLFLAFDKDPKVIVKKCLTNMSNLPLCLIEMILQFMD